jgi:hypothetical protein
MYEWHYVHYIDELARAGHTISSCNPVQVLGRIGSSEEYSEILVSAAKKVVETPGPHLMLATAHDMTVLPEAIDYVRQLGIPSVNFSVDDLTVHFYVRKIGSHFDLCWTTYIGAAEQLKKYGCRVIYMPMAANPYYFKARNNRRLHKLCFIGSRYGARGNYVARLAEAGIPMKVRGAGWIGGSQNKHHQSDQIERSRLAESVRLVTEFARFPAGRKIIAGALKKRITGDNIEELGADLTKADIGGPLPSFEEMIACYSGCTASLGVLEAGSTYTLKQPLVYYRLREFEAPMIGCAHIVRRVPELEQCFDEDKEMIFYTSMEECIDKARFYLTPERYDLCRAIGGKARARSEHDHTWLNRFSALCSALGIKMKP